MSNLKEDLKKQIIEDLNLEEVSIEDIADDTLLFAEDGLALDSIDALELIVLLEKNYGMKLANPEEGKQVFSSVNSMVEYIEANK